MANLASVSSCNVAALLISAVLLATVLLSNMLLSAHHVALGVLCCRPNRLSSHMPPHVQTFNLFALQLYVSGELVGGADIVTEMAEKGELQPLLRGQ